MTLRLGICFGVLLALLASGPGRAGEALVVNAGEATLSVVDMATEQELRRIPLLREPHHLTLTPDRHDLLVGDTLGNTLFDLDPMTFVERRRMPVSDPYQFGFSPDGRYLTVNGLGRNQVDVYAAATYTLLRRFPLASRPSHLAYAPDSSVVYVSLQGTGLLAAIDLNAMKLLWTAPVGSTPAGVLWLNDKVLVAIMGADHVAVTDPVDGHVEQVIHTGKGAHQLFLSPDRRVLWVNNRVDGTATAVDARTLAPLRTYKVPGGPDDTAFAPDGDLWITQRFVGKVAVLNPATGAIRSIPVGRQPHGLFLNTSLP
jgi:DNA-binding beta-propeller fold protein YncE